MLKWKESKINFKFWLPAIFWMGLIFYLSQQPNLTMGLGGNEEFIMRKLAHICEFGVLAILFAVLLKKGCNKKTTLAFLGAFSLTVVYAVSDEFHQTFIVGRSGNFQDVLVDLSGASLFLLVAAFFIFAQKRFLLFFLIVANILGIFLLILTMTQAIVGNRKNLKSSKLFQNENRESLINSEERRAQMQIASEEIENNDVEKLEIEVVKEEFIEKSDNEENSQIQQKAKTIPVKILLNVPFSSQAPMAIWDEFHEEACEEMSLIMVKYYFDKKELTPKVAETELQKIKDYQLQKNGHYLDSNMEELAIIATEYFKFEDVFVKKELTKEAILQYLAQGSPIIVPTAGRLLGNPNFTGLGPLYHNLVIIGFEEGEFIVNDPGTRKGEQYRYPMDVLMNAIHDFPGNKNEIEKGPKKGIVFAQKI